jgi:hypothetical protein
MNIKNLLKEITKQPSILAEEINSSTNDILPLRQQVRIGFV